MHLRPATVADCSFIAFHVLEAITLTMYEQPTLSADQQASVDELAGVCAQADTLYSYRHATIAETDGHPVGLMLCYPGADYHAMRARTFPQLAYFRGTDPEQMPDETEAGELYLDSLAVAKHYRGQGIGRALLQHFKHLAAERCLSASLLVDPDNARARTLYELEGFSGTEVRPAFGHNYLVYKQKSI